MYTVREIIQIKTFKSAKYIILLIHSGLIRKVFTREAGNIYMSGEVWRSIQGNHFYFITSIGESFKKRCTYGIAVLITSIFMTTI